MRLKNMYFLCKENQSIIAGRRYITEERASGDTKYTCSNSDVIASLQALHPIDCLAKNIDVILSTLDDGVLSHFSKKHQNIMGAWSQLNQQIETLVSLGESMGLNEFPSGFDIKVPTNLEFDEFASCVEDINKVLRQCPYLHSTDGPIQFEGVDVGSTWLSFVVGGAVLLNLTIILDKVIKLVSHMHTVKAQVKQYKYLEMDQAFLTEMMEAHNKVQKSLLDKCLKELQEECGNLEPEDNERARLTLEILAKWMDRGMEIHASIGSKAEVKDLFPTLNSQKKLSSPAEIALMEEKAEAELKNE